jgi:hypothetical protein
MCYSELAAMPKRDQHGNLVMVVRLADENASKFSYDDSVKAWFMLQDVTLLENGAVNGIVIITDAKNSSMGHIARISLSSVKKYYLYIQVQCAK